MDKIFTKHVLPWLHEVEGVFSDDPNDNGGTTKYGISLRYLKGVPDHDGDGFLDGDIDRDGDVDSDDIRALTKEDAAERYYRDFWKFYRCDEMPFHVGLCLLDAVVQHRPKTAIRLIQSGLKVNPDGVIGDVQTMPAAHKSSIFYFVQEHLSYRAQLYHDIVVSNSSQAKFLRGWMRRCFALQQYIQTGELPS